MDSAHLYLYVFLQPVQTAIAPILGFYEDFHFRRGTLPVSLRLLA
jgi:hypothetical protein